MHAIKGTLSDNLLSLLHWGNITPVLFVCDCLFSAGSTSPKLEDMQNKKKYNKYFGLGRRLLVPEWFSIILRRPTPGQCIISDNADTVVVDNGANFALRQPQWLHCLVYLMIGYKLVEWLIKKKKKLEKKKKQRQPSKDTRLSPKDNFNRKTARELQNAAREPEVSAAWGSAQSYDSELRA